MGPIHPRDKYPVGRRLAQAAYNTVYKGTEAYTGPTVSGCAVEPKGVLRVKFNRTLLRGDTVQLRAYNRSLANSGFRVLTNASAFCLQSTGCPYSDPKHQTFCVSRGPKGSGNYDEVCSPAPPTKPPTPRPPPHPPHPPKPPPPSYAPTHTPTKAPSHAGMTCQEKCWYDGHCCSGDVSTWNNPSCAVGCTVGAAGAARGDADAADCKATCDAIHAKGYPSPGTPPACSYAWTSTRTFNLCGQCETPAGGGGCFVPKTVDACYDGCAFAFGAPARRARAERAGRVAVDPSEAAARPGAMVAVEQNGETFVEQAPPPDSFLGGANPYENPEVWVAVNATLDTTTGDILLDLAPLNGTAPAAVRYAWHDMSDSCCAGIPDEGVANMCTPGSCPVFIAGANLPGNPWVAKIVGDKCQCISPQVCDE